MPAPAFIGWTMGVNHSTKGTETVNAINNLALITGNIGRAARRRSRSPASATPWARARPALRRACLAIASSRTPTIGASWRSSGASSEERIPSARGLAYPDIIEAALDRRIRALWIIATNPVVSFPNFGSLQQALEGARLPRRAGRVSPDSDIGVRAPHAAGGDVG